MTPLNSDPRPLYQQIADEIMNQIVRKELFEHERAPSTNELSRFYSINPTTSAKALTLLADKGILEKKRGLGMFVTPGALERIISDRKSVFVEQYITPLLHEAALLGLSTAELVELLTSTEK